MVFEYESYNHFLIKFIKELCLTDCNLRNKLALHKNTKIKLLIITKNT